MHRADPIISSKRDVALPYGLSQPRRAVRIFVTAGRGCWQLLKINPLGVFEPCKGLAGKGDHAGFVARCTGVKLR